MSASTASSTGSRVRRDMLEVNVYQQPSPFYPLIQDAPLGNADCFDLTSDFGLTWDQVTEMIAAAAGLEPDIVHIPSETIAAIDPGLGKELLGDKRHSLAFDNAKPKRFVPGFAPTLSFADRDRAVACLVQRRLCTEDDRRRARRPA